MTSPYTALPIPERLPSLGVSNVGKVVEIHDNNEKYRWESHSNRTDRGIRLETCDMDSVFPKGLRRKASLTAGEPARSPAIRIIDAIKYVNLGLDEALWKEHALKQLGNLAVTCAERNNVKLEVFNRCITLRICQPPKEIIHCIAWDDDRTVSRLIYELNHGCYMPPKVRKKSAAFSSEQRIQFPAADTTGKYY